ncbi:alpha/beta hydrolase [Fodinibius salsisoli]|uniref:Alpha/beta fold hydrolase n=1 Tax=Fodinibius salsisoli TaxID=2820877 RepID=A0ABT3PPP7_9BACT|nr:alpha/beta fold hydrolase [Fodinibius salsisoli]MCW9707811.1 alpha/beta fold hydrolase [Fodinibius salsisoli]
MIKPLLWIAGTIGAGYICILLLLYLFQAKMVYHPTEELWGDPSSVGLPFEEIIFETTDGIQLHGWFISAGSEKPTVLYCHGNAGNISGRLASIKLLHSLGVNVFIFDYRGYGKSEGSPSEQGTYRDAKAAWDYLTTVRGIDSKNIIIKGRSLGGAIAAWLGARTNPAALIIESTFTSAADLGADLYPWLPVRQLLRYQYPTIDYIKEVKVPLFMAHSRDDRVVPFHHGNVLFEAAPEPKTFVELQGSHGTGFLDTGLEYREALQQFLDTDAYPNSKD